LRRVESNSSLLRRDSSSTARRLRCLDMQWVLNRTARVYAAS
jgi:hypothetical protein